MCGVPLKLTGYPKVNTFLRIKSVNFRGNLLYVKYGSKKVTGAIVLTKNIFLEKLSAVRKFSGGLIVVKKKLASLEHT